MSLTDDIAAGIVSALTATRFDTWKFHAAVADTFQEAAESNQNIAIVRPPAVPEVDARWAGSMRAVYDFEVLTQVYDRDDAATNVSDLSDQMLEAFSDDGSVLTAAVTDSGSNLLDTQLEVEIVGVVTYRDPEDGGAPMHKRHQAVWTIRVGCYITQPLS